MFELAHYFKIQNKTKSAMNKKGKLSYYRGQKLKQRSIFVKDLSLNTLQYKVV